jgi:hypothetical protein
MNRVITAVAPVHLNEYFSQTDCKSKQLMMDDMIIVQEVKYLKWHAVHTKKCPSLSQKKGQFNLCSCMSYFLEVNSEDNNTCNLINLTGRFMAYFAKLDKSSQQLHVMSWYRTASHLWTRQTSLGVKGHAPKSYRIPVLSDVENNIVIREPPLVCMSAMQIITGKKVSFWRTCLRAVQNNTVPEHGLVGKPSNNTKFLEETLDDLQTFFEEIKAFCDVIPTRFVRDQTGQQTTRDGNDDALCLPPYWSKLKLYCRWCYECGWDVDLTSKGMILSKRGDWPAGEDAKQVVSWTYFWFYWKNKYGNILIRRPTADICDDCYLFYNQVKFKSTKTLSPFIAVDSTDDESSIDNDCGDDSNKDDNDDEQPNAIVKINWKSETTILEDDSLETMIEKASKHVQQAKNMRALLSGKARMALEWYESIQHQPTITEERWLNAVDCVVGDYCQNLALPYLGEHQPGETYYFSPLTVNCFGLANVGRDKAMLTAYIYHEGEGKKGGNNVASLIHRYLDEQGYIRRGQGPRKELNIVMDNCGGQNNHKYVLRLAPLFVELKYYRRVNIIFLVAGHTKNAADRLFNLLKQDYCKSQVFTMEQLQQVLDSNQYVECIKVGPDDFYNYGKLEDTLYKTAPMMGHTKKYQLFYSTDAEPGIIIAKESNMATSEHRMDLNKGKQQDRQDILRDIDIDNLGMTMENLTVEGIRTIKQVELYSKWRKHVPDEHKSPLYDNPGDDVLQSVKEDRKNKKKYIEESRLKKQAVDATGKLASRKSPEPKTRPAKQKLTTKGKSTNTTLSNKTIEKKPRARKAPEKASKQKK